MSDDTSSTTNRSLSPSVPTMGSSSLVTRLTFEIPKPKDWQLFQRLCVLLFKEELSDPNAMEYGRSGQDQSGIDIIARRGGDPDRAVGIQCRRIIKPLRFTKILADCREALKLETRLKEIIFATTAPDDVKATDDALRVQGILREEGYEVSVIIYGWDALQNIIAIHESVYNVWRPSQVSTSIPQVVPPGADVVSNLMVQLATLSEQLRLTTLASPPREAGKPEASNEDPPLHAKIDTFRDLFNNETQPLVAQKGLLNLLETENFSNKPWAKYRIISNLGSIALALGREAEAADRYEAAYQLRPEDPNAIANLALARTIQRRYPEAMELAGKAIAGEPSAEHAILYLLQAASRSDWQGEPETLIPTNLLGSVHADIGLAEFIGRRALPGWARRTIELGARHQDVPEFRRMVALAVLTLAQNLDSNAPDGSDPIEPASIRQAADDLKAMAEFCIEFDFSDRRDLIAYLGNAGMALRLSGRHNECEELLTKGLSKVGDDDHLKRLLGLTQATLGRPLDGLQTLAGTVDPENRLLAAELSSFNDPEAALASAIALPSEQLTADLQEMRWRLIGELAIRVGNEAGLHEALQGLRALNPAHVIVPLFEIRWASKNGADDNEVRARLGDIAKTLGSDTILLYRFLVAEEMFSFGMSLEASTLLESTIDVRRPGPTTTLYLKALAAARRDEAFSAALKNASPMVRRDPEILWTAAAHAWNTGDLGAALEFVEELLAVSPDNSAARLLKIEIFLREDRTADVMEELSKPIENLRFRRIADRFRLASLLGHFGHRARAVSLAYRLFLENQDKSQAWMTLSMLVLDVGMGRQIEPHPWAISSVEPNAAVDILYDDGEQLFFIVEPDATLRALDNASWEPSHALCQVILGQAAGTRFTDLNGREGRIVALRHKYVARLHYILKNHERRFPEILGFRSVTVDVSAPDGLDDLIAELKERDDWLQQEQEHYQRGTLPLAVLAHRLGLDTIQAAAGIAEQGMKLNVALGTVEEANAALAAISLNKSVGCVMDLLCFWNAWRTKSLGAIMATCGTVYVPRSVVDRLQRRIEEFTRSQHDGRRFARYEAGKLAISEVSAEVVQSWLDDTQLALTWIHENAVVAPIVAENKLPEAMRQYLRGKSTDVFDAVVVAMHNQLLLVSDDLPTRQVSSALGWTANTSLHQVFIAANNAGKATYDQLVKWEAFLIDSGQNYIGISYGALLKATQLDFEAGEVPGYLTDRLASVLGGRNAEPHSHVNTVLKCIFSLWGDPRTFAYREAVTGLLLRALTRERDDYADMLRAIAYQCAAFPHVTAYLRRWIAGHFLPRDILG